MMGPPLIPALITLKGLSYINIIIIMIIVIISFIIISIIIIQMFGPSCKWLPCASHCLWGNKVSFQHIL